MHINEIDWKYHPIRRILACLDRDLAKIEHDYEDVDDMLEDAQCLVGIAFVAIQVYIRSAREDLAQVFSARPDLREFMRAEEPVVKGAQTTYIEAIWAAANYYKHHDEWRDWEKVRRKDTVSVFKRLGISSKTEYPCVEVLRRLQGEQWSLVSLLALARSWRESCLSKLKGSATESTV